jgi:hypothetical protein
MSIQFTDNESARTKGSQAKVIERVFMCTSSSEFIKYQTLKLSRECVKRIVLYKIVGLY